MGGGGEGEGLLEMKNHTKNRQKPQNRNKFRPNPKSRIKAFTGKAFIGSPQYLSLCYLIFIHLNLLYSPKLFLHTGTSLISAGLFIG